MMIDPQNPVIQRIVAGTQAEYAGRPEEARALYWQAWTSAADDYEACIAAHYVARLQPNPADSLYWNQVALARAEAAEPSRVKDFYPSLYLNLGQSHEQLGHPAEARHFYDLAAQLGAPHQPE